MVNDRYPKQVFWSDEDEGFIAIVPDLPGCSAFGETEADALAEVEEAIQAWKAAAVAAGNVVPKPSDLTEQGYSGKVALRMPRALHRDLVQAAREQDTSLNQYIVYLLGRNSQRDMITRHVSALADYSPITFHRLTAICLHGTPVQAVNEIYSYDSRLLKFDTYSSDSQLRLIDG